MQEKERGRKREKGGGRRGGSDRQTNKGTDTDRQRDRNQDTYHTHREGKQMRCGVTGGLFAGLVA